MNQLIYQAGLKVTQLQMCKFPTLGVNREKLKDVFLNAYPITADTIVVICVKKDSSTE